MAISSASRHAPPVRVAGENRTSPLKRVFLGKGERDDGRREAFLQELAYSHPEVIPIGEIEPAFAPLISICRELPTPAGPADNLWLTPSGGIVIGECKLIRNGQARREVVAQALDYARAIRTWHFDDLQDAVRRATQREGATLWSFVEERSDLEESEFTDAIERHLRDGHVLLLVIGDGINEGAEALSSYLQLHAGVQAGLALVELSVWELEPDELLVVPRIPLRTALVERGIVRIDASGAVRIDAPGSGPSGEIVRAVKPETLSEIEYYGMLNERRPGLGNQFRAFAVSLESTGVSVELRKSAILRVSVSPDDEVSAGYVDSYGRAWLGDAWAGAARLQHPEAGERYLETVALLIGGQVQPRKQKPPIVVGPDGKVVDLKLLLDHAEAWKEAIIHFSLDLSETVGAKRG